MGVPPPKGHTWKALTSKDEDRTHPPNLAQKIYSSPHPEAKKAGVRTTGGKEQLDTQVRVSCPFLPLLEEVYIANKPAEMVILQEDTAECPKMAVAWLKERQSPYSAGRSPRPI